MKKSVLTMMVGMLLVATLTFAAEPKASPETGGNTSEANKPVKSVVKENTQEAGKESAPQGADMRVTLRVPVFSSLFSRTPVAVVNDDPILMDDFTEALASIHESAGGTGGVQKAGKKDFELVLNRLVNARLILQEGVNMGLDEQPEVKKALADFSESTLREVLKRRQVKDAVPDEKVVDKIYRETVKEWKIRSLKFDKKEDAEAFAKEIKAGGNFTELADKLIDNGKAQGGKVGEFVKPKDLLPQIAYLISSLKMGDVSPVVPVGPAFTIVKLEDVRYPEGNAEAMTEAKEKALELKRSELLEKYWAGLKNKYVKLNKKVLDKLNFEAPKPGIDKLLKDKRVVAEITGEKPITVGELTETVRGKFFHDIKEAIKLKRVNEGKIPSLEDMLLKRVFRLEAMKQGIDRSDEYRTAVRKYRDSLIFGTFIDKAITPEIKVTNEEIKAYYDEHIGDYSSPEMIKIRSLAFSKKNNAEDAIEKLRKGSEFQWLAANAEGQVAADSPGLLEFENNLLIRKNLPDQMEKVIAGAKPGDIKLYASPEGYFYLLNIQDIVPSKPTPMETERKTIGQKVFGVKLTKAVEDWAEKLRKASTVKVYLTD
jgi:parvulin-like peptidyl-prolyl isomerase